MHERARTHTHTHNVLVFTDKDKHAYIYIYTYIYMYIYTYVYIHNQICSCMQEGEQRGNSVHAYMCESVCEVYGCVCMFLCERVCAFICINECACVRVCVSLLQVRFLKQINESGKHTSTPNSTET